MSCTEKWRISAWKTYTQFGPNGKGYFLHDDVGIRFIEKARTLGVKNICIHKGLPFGSRSYEHGPVQRHRRRRQALSGRELPDLSLGLRQHR